MICLWRCLAGISLLFAGTSLAGADANSGGSGAPSQGGEPFQGYDELCGYPLVVANTVQVSLAIADENGEPIIVLDPKLYEDLEEYRRQFLIAHECAHHRLGHVTEHGLALRSKSRSAVRDQEMSADCWAAEKLAEAGNDRTVRVMMDRFFKSGYYSPGGGYPSGLQRSTIIRECAVTGRARRAGANLQRAGD